MAWWNFDSTAFKILFFGTAALAALLVILALAALFLQLQADRRNAARIAAYKKWENILPEYIFGIALLPSDLARIRPEDRNFFRAFLIRSMATIGGDEGARVRELYCAAGLDKEIPKRLRHRSPRIRAMAALEIGTFGLDEYYPNLVPLLEDGVPFVAFAAARVLPQSRNLVFANPVFGWVVTQEQYQQERLITIMERFGPDLLPWLEAVLRDRPALSSEWRLFATLVASHRHHESLPILLELLDSQNPEVQSAAIRALQVLGDPTAYASVTRFVYHENPVLRMQAAQSLGELGGPSALPLLMELLADPVFDVRRHASLSLGNLGPAGITALAGVVSNPASDPYARDMAQERLEWAEHRGRL